jgi:hypothetical protein
VQIKGVLKPCGEISAVCGLDRLVYNYFTGKVEAFDVEMDNSSSELVDYFLKRTNAVRR